MPRIKDVREDIRARLLQCGAFSNVYLHLPEEAGWPASDATGAAVEVSSGEAAPRWDIPSGGGDDVVLENEETITVVVMARDGDPDRRDSTAELLVQFLKDAVNGRSLAGLTIPKMTFVRRWAPEKARPPERRYRCAVKAAHLTEGADNYDTDL